METSRQQKQLEQSNANIDYQDRTKILRFIGKVKMFCMNEKTQSRKVKKAKSENFLYEWEIIL